MDKKKAIKEYWEDPETISMKDKNLHEMETASIARHIKPNDTVVDIGCGDGFATKVYAESCYELIAVEYSKTMYDKAVKNLKGCENVKIMNADLLDNNLIAHLKEFEPSVVVSQRFLINLESWKEQTRAIHTIMGFLREEGKFIFAENFIGSFQRMNWYRHFSGVPEIKPHWHNLYLDETKTEKLMEMYGTIESIEAFNTYIYLTRVAFPAILPPFSVMEFDDKARAFSECMKEVNPVALGPNQTWVVRKK